VTEADFDWAPLFDLHTECSATDMTDFAAWIEKNKALWTRVYDEIIAPDLEDEWKKRMCARTIPVQGDC
jgi:hypothetical protein